MTEREPNVGIVGTHVEQSLSPLLHNTAYEEMGLDDFYYGRFQAPEYYLPASRQAYLEKFLDECARNGVVGLSITMPFKEDVMGINRSSGGSLPAERIKAVNTLSHPSQEIWTADNTDWLGVLRAFEEADVEFEGEKALVLGAGGATKAILYALAVRGISEVTIAARSTEKAEKLSGEWSKKFPAVQFGAVDIVGLQDGTDHATTEGVNIVVHATPIGQHGTEHVGQLPMDVGLLEPETAVMDIVYMPVETPLVEAAKARKDLLVIDGTRMLLHQAVEQIKLFTGEYDVPIDAMDTALRGEIAQRAA